MSQDVGAYIASCIVCIRRNKLPRRQTLRGVLTRPVPFQLISVDYVGPRTVYAIDWYYLVVIDHASRFVVADATTSPSAAHARSVLETRWCAIFQAPLAVLSDRGSTFRSAAFTEYVTAEVRAYHVFTSPYYPQGNGINEACHASLEVTISAVLRETTDVAAALRDAVMVHNATPHVGTGMSPFFFLFGYEPVFPGWQPLSQVANTPTSRIERDQGRIRRALLDAYARDERKLEVRDDIVVGDWVVYPLGEYEKQRSSHPATTSRAMCPGMSLPSKVVEVRGESLSVAILGTPQLRRDVAKAVCKVLRVEVPPTLQKLALDVMRYEIPRVPISINVRRNLAAGVGSTWDQLATESQEQPHNPEAKRAKVVPTYKEM